MIVTDENKLRIICEPVVSEEIENLRNKLEEALIWSEKRGNPGVGLACPQIGIAKKMAIIRIYPKIRLDLINAEIVEKYDEIEFEGEGCLSFPGRFETTKRFKEIVVVNNYIWPYKFIATDFVSVAIQHELDHLKGILLPDVALNK